MEYERSIDIIIFCCNQCRFIPFGNGWDIEIVSDKLSVMCIVIPEPVIKRLW